MKKKTLLLLLLFFLVSCTVSNNNSNGSWNSGTDGLVINYEPGEPRAEYLDNQQVEVTIKYENAGASDATNIEFNLIGNDRSLLSLPLVEGYRRSLSGKTQSNPEGLPPEYAVWKSGVNLPSSDIDSFDQVISVVACYNYKTSAEGIVCLEPDTRNPECDFSVRDIGSSQGAPIAITEVKRQVADNELLVEVHFDNKGSGSPITGECVDPQIKEFDVISLSSVKIGGTKNNPRLTLPCSPEQIRLQNNKGYTICKTRFSGNLRSEEQIYIELSYKYREKLQDKKITIINPQ